MINIDRIKEDPILTLAQSINSISVVSLGLSRKKGATNLID
jgi:hypothetical protein